MTGLELVDVLQAAIVALCGGGVGAGGVLAAQRRRGAPLSEEELRKKWEAEQDEKRQSREDMKSDVRQVIAEELKPELQELISEFRAFRADLRSSTSGAESPPD